MIQIHIDGHSISVQGHAPRAAGTPPGQNIVCAAVSALTLTLIEGLRLVAGMNIKADTSPGDVLIVWTAASDAGAALIDTWYLGISRIQESYPNTIVII